jgi:hypothetical protein
VHPSLSYPYWLTISHADFLPELNSANLFPLILGQDNPSAFNDNNCLHMHLFKQKHE